MESRGESGLNLFLCYPREYYPDAKTVEVFALGGEGFQPAKSYKAGETLRSPLLEGLEVDLAKVF